MADPFRQIDAVELARELFSVSDAEAIIESVNDAGAADSADALQFGADLARNLNTLSAHYAADDYAQDLPRSNELAVRLTRISDLAKKLIAELGADENGVAHNLGPGVLWKSARLRGATSGQDAVIAAARGIVGLQRLTEFAANLAWIDARENPAAPGRRPDNALGDLIRGLGESFEWAWRQKPSRSTVVSQFENGR